MSFDDGACGRYQEPDTCRGSEDCVTEWCFWCLLEALEQARQAERAAVMRWLRDSVQYQKWALPEDSRAWVTPEYFMSASWTTWLAWWQRSTQTAVRAKTTRGTSRLTSKRSTRSWQPRRPTMDAEHLAAIAERADKATPGPWARVDMPWRTPELAAYVVTGRGDPHLGKLVASAPEVDEWEDKPGEFERLVAGEADMAFIAHAREDIPTLVAEVRRLREEREAVRLGSETAIGAADKRIAELEAEVRVLREDNKDHVDRCYKAERERDKAREENVSDAIRQLIAYFETRDLRAAYILRNLSEEDLRALLGEGATDGEIAAAQREAEERGMKAMLNVSMGDLKKIAVAQARRDAFREAESYAASQIDPGIAGTSEAWGNDVAANIADWTRSQRLRGRGFAASRSSDDRQTEITMTASRPRS
jgi:hypothetical protein